MTRTAALTSEMLDRLPPQSLEAERAVVGACISKPEIIDDLSLRPEDFHSSAHQTIYRHACETWNAHHAVDVGLLVASLKASGNYEAVGGMEYVVGLFDAAGAPSNAGYHAEIVAKHALQRRLFLELSQVAAQAMDPTSDPKELIAEVENALARVSNNGDARGPVAAAEIVTDTMIYLDELGQREGALGIPMGLRSIDCEIGGLFDEELIVLGARPGVGKTAMALQVLAHAATTSRYVLFASLEMSRQELATRLLSSQAGVDSSRFRTGRITAEDRRRIVDVGPMFHAATFSIIDRPRLTVADIAREARRMKRGDKLDLIIIDYLTRLSPADPRARRHEQVGRLAGDLKLLAREMKVPILCLAQLNRQSETGKDGYRPRLSHLRESGDIEADADMVILIHRAEIYSPNDSDLRGKAELLIVKNRNGRTGDFKLEWDAMTTTFRSPDEDWHQHEWEP